MAQRKTLDDLIRRNRAMSLGHYFRSLARASVAASAIAAASCSGSWPDRSDGFVEIACDGSPAPRNWIVDELDTMDEALTTVVAAGYQVPCEDFANGAIREVEGGWEVVATKKRVDECSGNTLEQTRHLLFVSPEGEVSEMDSTVVVPDQGPPPCAIGRRPPGLVDVSREAGSSLRPIGEHFAAATRLEAASVDAFGILACELEALGAPDELVADCRRSAQEEIRHAAMTASIARKYGGHIEPPRVESRPLRTLYELALDNAVEGCVRETFGALIATYQAMAARDLEIASAMDEIAQDETRHASLSWRIAEWAETRLSADERAALAAGRRAAIVALRNETATLLPRELEETAGLPPTEMALEWIDQFERDVWMTEGSR